ncbi:class I SAM-dependent methyltransferase family protein [Candidatus Woesearchaeota archaeon]|nr:class I SAM-dependent methyltransferase family protein [Candidatus Woesearchaeota archaeon]
MKKKKPTSLKQALKKKLNKKELSLVVTSYDMVGDIAIIEIPIELEKKEKIIAKTLLDLHKNINVVVKKAGVHKGVYRTQNMFILAGEDRKETVHRENNIEIKLDIEKVYFSVRLSTERKRIMEQVKKDEEVLVMFSGVSPYCLVIAKNTDAKRVYGVEINPAAHKYAEENVKLNKLDGKIKLYNGDVRMVVPRLRKKFDRVLMPLPKEGEGFLDVALKAVKEEGRIHFYDFEHEKDINLAKEKVKESCRKFKKKCRILRTVKCGQVGPREYRLCVDFKVIS